jgi:hypothetical protein
VQVDMKVGVLIDKRMVEVEQVQVDMMEEVVVELVHMKEEGVEVGLVQVDMKVGVLVDKRMVEVEQVVEVVVDMMVVEVVLELGQVDMTEVEEVVVVLPDKMALEEVQRDKMEVLEAVTPLVE